MFEKHVIAIRIYYGLNSTPMADLRMNDAKARKNFESMINGYTLVYDERPKRKWEEWL